MEKERRQFDRPESLNLLDYIVVDDQGRQGEYSMGRTLNVSEGGILLETRSELPVGSQIMLTLGLNDTLIEVMGKIVRTSPEENLYKTGIEFTNLSEGHREILQQYIVAFNAHFNAHDNPEKIHDAYKDVLVKTIKLHGF